MKQLGRTFKMQLSKRCDHLNSKLKPKFGDIHWSYYRIKRSIQFEHLKKFSGHK